MSEQAQTQPSARSESAWASRGWDRAIFGDRQLYSEYFHQLELACELLLASYRGKAEAARDEVRTVEGLLERLQATVSTLALKYAFVSEDAKPLEVDVTRSGFPNFGEVNAMAVELTLRARRMQDLAPLVFLKRKLVDHLIKQKTDSPELLAQIAERAYLESLEPDRLFLPFTEHLLEVRKQTRKVRNYVYAWGCYDFASNRPFLHLMAFDQDTKEEPLEEGGESYRRFMEVMRAEGARAPDLGIMALAIDDALETIHPKVLKRIRIGPLYAHAVLDHAPEDAEDARQEAVRGLLEKYATSRDDLVMFFRDEVVFSVDQRTVRSLLSPVGRIREIFHIPESDPEAYENRVSVTHRHVLMPHHLLTSLSPAERETIPRFDTTRVFAYDGEKKVYGI